MGSIMLNWKSNKKTFQTIEKEIGCNMEKVDIFEIFPTAYKPAAVPQDYQGFSVTDNQIKNNKIILLLLFCSKLTFCVGIWL